jgi:hypothetical protein
LEVKEEEEEEEEVGSVKRSQQAVIFKVSGFF